MKSYTRRDFVKSSIVGGLALVAPFSRVRGANGDLRVAVAGIRGRGWGLAREFHGADRVRVVALCDVDEKVLESRVKWFLFNPGCPAFWDFHHSVFPFLYGFRGVRVRSVNFRVSLLRNCPITQKPQL